jgi:hypothetical protein
MTRLEKFYKDQVVAKLTEQFGYQNVMQVPRITKITLNMGVGEAAGNKKVLENAVADMAKIAGQKPITTKARVSVASFKIRDGWPIGCKVTLRRAQMWEFLDRLINISLPRVRDFPRCLGQGVRRSWQLQLRHQGTDHLPGDRFRPGRCVARHGYLHHHDGADRQRGEGPVDGLQLPVPELSDHP